MALNKNYITDTPQYQGKNLPTLDDFGGDVPAYMAALKAAYEADTNNSQPAFAAPGTFTTPDGQQMSSAGYHLDKSAGQVAADAYNYIMQRAAMSQVKGPGVGLTAQSRMSVRPEEAALAYNAYKLGESGLPEFQLNPYMANLMEDYGMRSPEKPAAPGVDHPPRTSGRGPRDTQPPRTGGRPPRGGSIDPGQDRPPLIGAQHPVGGGSPAIPGGVSPMPGEYPSIGGYNPPSGIDIPKPGYGTAGMPYSGGQSFEQGGNYPPGLLEALAAKPGGGPNSYQPPSSIPNLPTSPYTGNDFAGMTLRPNSAAPGLPEWLTAFGNHRNPTGGVGY